MASKRVSLKGKGAELFFGGTDLPAAPEEQPTVLPPAAESAPHTDDRPKRRPGRPSPSAAARSDAPAASSQASQIASSLAIDADTMAGIRRLVKTPGREVSFVRLSAEEKARLGEVVYAYKRQGQKITETEIARIAVNCLLADHERHGDGSLLARLLASLRA